MCDMCRIHIYMYTETPKKLHQRVHRLKKSFDFVDSSVCKSKRSLALPYPSRTLQSQKNNHTHIHTHTHTHTQAKCIWWIHLFSFGCVKANSRTDTHTHTQTHIKPHTFLFIRTFFLAKLLYHCFRPPFSPFQNHAHTHTHSHTHTHT